MALIRPWPTIFRLHRKVLTALLALGLPAIAPASEEGEDGEEDLRCINSRTIRRTDVVDDSNIIFYMRGSKIYLNTLPKTCKGLSDERRFTYGSYTRSLCEFDRINVLKDSTFGAYEGRACKLGRFRLVTQDDVAYLFDQRHRVPEAERVDPPPVEELILDDPEENDPR